MAITVLFTVFGCDGVELSTPAETKLTLDYHYLWDYDSIPPRLQIGRKTSSNGYTILISGVVSYGWNDNYIVTKNKSSEGTVSYTIMVLNKDMSSVNDYISLFDKLTYENYVEKRKELNIPDNLIFTRNYKQKKMPNKEQFYGLSTAPDLGVGKEEKR